MRPNSTSRRKVTKLLYSHSFQVPLVPRGSRRYSARSDGNVDADDASAAKSPRGIGVSAHKPAQASEEQDAMTRRLRSLGDTDLSGTRREDIEAAGFSEDLKNELLGRIATAKGSQRALYPSAFATSEAPSSTGQGSRDIAAAEPWRGNESISDATLRMLDDSHKRIRVPSQAPSPATRPPTRIDTGRQRRGDKVAGTGVRLANARDRSSTYSYLKDDSLTHEEKEKMRKELKDRFTAGARPMPTTLQGLSSLANERIEDAIARGQFKNLPSRGKKIERDYTASSPFLDTTEYFMNKIIQRQDITPPWIERQQELVASVNRFRSRLRADWRRHAARMVASAGGDLNAQIRRAERFAAAEMVHNPQQKRAQQDTQGNDQHGHVSQITLSGELRPSPTDGNPGQGVDAPDIAVLAKDEVQSSSTQVEDVTGQVEPDSSRDTVGSLFRDPEWEKTEYAYFNTAIKDLNALTRTYNLMAPDLAKKPYYNLERELKACYADVAPTLALEIKERALGRAHDPAVSASQNQTVLQQFGGGGHVSRVRDEDQTRQYGFRQFVRDVFGRKRNIET